MDSKACSACKVTKTLDQFQVRRASHDGVTAACDACLKERDRARYPKERGHRLDRQKAYTQTKGGKEAMDRARDKWKSFNAEKRAAHVITGNAIRDGRLLRPEVCNACNKIRKLHAHHDDYAKPLEVRWLCDSCHKAHHKKERTGVVNPGPPKSSSSV